MEKQFKIKEALQSLLLTFTQKEIAEQYGVHLGTIETYVAKYGLQGYKESCELKANTLNLTLENPYFCYFLGLFVTDGYYAQDKRIEVSQKHGEVLYHLQKQLGGKVYRSSKNKGKYIYVLTNVNDIFTNLGFTPGPKTFDVQVPIGIITHRFEYLFVRGLIDGDGTISPLGKIRFFSISPYLNTYYHTFLQRTKIGFSFYPQAGGLSTECTGSAFEQMSLLILLYNKRFPELCIPHKLQRVQKLIDDIVQTYQMINGMK
jgi:hypothetical protein